MKNKWIGYVAGLGLLGACSTEVDLCYGDHPHRSLLDIRFDWAANDVDICPDSMYVVAFRPVNQLKYGFRVTSAPEPATNQTEGVLLFPEAERVDKNENKNPGQSVNPGTPEGAEEPEPAENVGEDTGGEGGNGNTSLLPEQDRLWMHNGKYMLVAFNGTSSAFESSLADFADNEYTVLNDLEVKYKTYETVDRLPGAAKYWNWIDRNPYSAYVQEDVEPIFYATNSSLEVPVSAKASSKVTCRFTPRRLTQKVIVQFNITKKEEGIKIDSVQAEISGVASAIQLSTGNLTVDKTYKVLFTPAYSRTDDVYDDMTSMRIRGEVNVAGLLANTSASLLTGPGVMHVDIYTTVKEEDRTVVRVFKAGINMYRLLHKTPSITKDARTGYWKQARRDLSLSVTLPLEITRDAVLKSKGNGVDLWQPIEVVDLDM